MVKNRVELCTESESLACDKLHNCHACHTDQNCAFKKNNGCINLISIEGNKTARAVSEHFRAECEKHCSEKTDCKNCTANSGCMWCANLGRCLETNAYAAMFPVGQCTEWSTSKCDKVCCSRIRSCSECLRHERCGWCDDGRGKCMKRAATGPVLTENQNFQWFSKNTTPTSVHFMVKRTCS
ncbi:attractin-like protein 1 [Galendromus occidentalis]|uniref:Attractin-like protein 1 n=1 Tax=Galendromus occidentalis TaxID=34638 RepID=A0AAJ6VW28_9ACAR|nr:attractin-like protein 1 [Galendromus occidentalis]